jgi:hypothetical protein
VIIGCRRFELELDFTLKSINDQMISQLYESSTAA